MWRELCGECGCGQWKGSVGGVGILYTLLQITQRWVHFFDVIDKETGMYMCVCVVVICTLRNCDHRLYFIAYILLF